MRPFSTCPMAHIGLFSLVCCYRLFTWRQETQHNKKIKIKKPKGFMNIRYSLQRSILIRRIINRIITMWLAPCWRVDIMIIHNGRIKIHQTLFSLQHDFQPPKMKTLNFTKRALWAWLFHYSLACQFWSYRLFFSKSNW